MVERSKLVWVSNIPGDQTEEQVTEIFKSAGPVANVRLQFDSATNKSLGSAVVEYLDIDTAASAVRNLNNFKIGSHAIRVEFKSEHGMSGIL
jgi:cleavage stimulation factor subunit 2